MEEHSLTDKPGTSVDKLSSIYLGKTTPLRTAVWRLRRGLRNLFGGRDILNVEIPERKTGRVIRETYRTIDTFMGRFFPKSKRVASKKVALKRLTDMMDELEYTVVDADETKPWGAYYRMDNSEVDRFIREFFPGLSLNEAKLGHKDVSLSPKFLLVMPGQRLSWQYHDRRAERWRFLTDGAYHKSATDAEGKRIIAKAGEVVQFARGERHRLCANEKGYTLVAEIWQHTDPKYPSEEADIIRLSDDYKRA